MAGHFQKLAGDRTGEDLVTFQVKPQLALVKAEPLKMG